VSADPWLEREGRKLAADFAAWQGRMASNPAWQEWQRSQPLKRVEAAGELQEFQRERCGGPPVLTVGVIVGPAEAAAAHSTVVAQAAEAPAERKVFPADLLAYIEKARTYCGEARKDRAELAADLILMAGEGFREMLAALEAGNAFLAADQGATCAAEVANAIACMHLPRADASYHVAASKRAAAQARQAVWLGQLLPAYDDAKGKHRTRMRTALGVKLPALADGTPPPTRDYLRKLLADALRERSGKLQRVPL
jgi:hypothetical protein